MVISCSANLVDNPFAASWGEGDQTLLCLKMRFTEKSSYQNLKDIGIMIRLCKFVSFLKKGLKVATIMVLHNGAPQYVSFWIGCLPMLMSQRSTFAEVVLDSIKCL